MANKKKACKHCKEYFEAEKMIKLGSYTFCTMSHGIEFAQNKARLKTKKEKEKKHREDLKRIRRNPRKEALEAAQLLARISEADENGYCTCVTCGHIGKYNDGFDGGHFIAKGNCSYWMLDPRNIHPQCKGCNGFKMQHGSAQVQYTLWMIDKYGREFVDHMKEKQRTVIKRSTADYDEFISKTKAEIAMHKARIS